MKAEVAPAKYGAEEGDAGRVGAALPSRWRTRGAHLSLLVLATWLVYWTGLTAPFVHDDPATILHNPAVADPSLLVHTERLDGLPIYADLRNSIRARTFTYLTFALNARVGGWAPVAFRLVNVAIHALNACLVYLLVAGLMARARRDDPGAADARHDGASGLALVVALLFAVHPIQISAVTYVTQRFTSLVALLYLGALVGYVAGRSARDLREGAPYLVGSLLATALAMKTKETALTIPFTLTLAEWMFFEGPRARRALLLTPFWGTTAILLTTVFSAVPGEATVTGMLAQATDLMNLDQISRSSYLFTQFPVIATYLRLLLLPVGLNFDHDFPVFDDLLAPQVLASLVVLAALLSTAFLLLARARRRRDEVGALLRLGAFGLFFFFVALSMSSSVIPINDVINEYRVYLSSVGLFLAVAAGGEALLRSRTLATPQRGVAIACVTVVAALAASTIARNRVWSDPLKFRQDAWSKSPAKMRVARALAQEYLARGEGEEALATLNTLARLNPELGKPHFLLGDAYLRLGRLDEAIAELERAKAIRSDQAEIYVGLVRAYAAQGRVALAVEALDAAERFESDPAARAALASMRAFIVPPPGDPP